MTNLNLQDATGRWTMEEIPNSEKVFKADLVIIAAGFLGPEKTLAEQFGLKKVRLLCFCPQLCCLSVRFLRYFLYDFFCRTPEVILPLKRTSFWPVFPKYMPQEVRFYIGLFPQLFRPIQKECLRFSFSSFRLVLLGLQELSFQKIWVLGSHFPRYLFYSRF